MTNYEITTICTTALLAVKSGNNALGKLNLEFAMEQAEDSSQNHICISFGDQMLAVVNGRMEKTQAETEAIKAKNTESFFQSSGLKLVPAIEEEPEDEPEEEQVKFRVGKEYGCNSACNHTCWWFFTVVRRTEKTVWLKNQDGEVLQRRPHVWNGVESISPFGVYSMSPSLSASRPTKTEKV